MQTFNELLQQAHALHRQRQFEAAAKVYRELVRRQPNDARLASLFARLRFDQGRWEDAILLDEKASRLDPRHAFYHYHRGLALAQLERTDGAIAAMERACEIDPQAAQALSWLTRLSLSACDWRKIESNIEKVIALVRSGGAGIEPFLLLQISDDPSDHLRCARAYALEMTKNAVELLPAKALTHPAREAPAKIRVGYLSADFRNHPTTHLLSELIELHDRERFEIVGLSMGPDDKSAYRERIARGFDRFIDTADWPAVEFVKRLHALDLDILVDLMGHTAFGHIGLLSARPAPVMVCYLGYPGTTGTEFIDYAIVDGFVAPAGADECFSERLVRMPASYQVNDRKRPAPERAPARAECGLPEQGFVFCCFNKPDKILPGMFDIWMRLLQAVPGSVLWLGGPSEKPMANLRREAESRGVDPSRLLYAPSLPLHEHLARLRHADLVLDTLPYNAHTTASDALWVGVPVVTCPGRSFQSRVAGSLLHAAGMPELVTGSLADYERLALELARDPEKLGALRRRLADNRDRVPLFDTPRFCADLERAFEAMVDLQRRGEPPRAIGIEKAG